MIIGLGTDIVSVSRIEKIVTKNKEAFLARLLSPAERKFFREEDMSAEFLAGRWAAKEACVKALSCGFGKDCAMEDITILRETGPHASGRPILTLTGKGKETAERLGVKHIHTSISHEREFASAAVILES